MSAPPRPALGLPPRGFSLGFRRRGEAVVVAVRGDLDAATAGQLDARLDDLVVGQGNLSVVVDVAEVPFIDSQGLTVLAKAWKKSRARGGELRVDNASRSVARVFAITGLERVLAGTEEGSCCGHP